MLKYIIPGALATAAISLGAPQLVTFIQQEQAAREVAQIDERYHQELQDALNSKIAAEARADGEYADAIKRAGNERDTAMERIEKKYPKAYPSAVASPKTDTPETL